MNRLMRKMLFGSVFCLMLCALALTWSNVIATNVSAPKPTQAPSNPNLIVGSSSQNDTSPLLREIPLVPVQCEELHELNPWDFPTMQLSNAPDSVVQGWPGIDTMPNPILNFEGIPYPGVGCYCAPPDSNGEVGATQYIQTVNQGIQIFDKTTGASLYGPASLSVLWSGFGGICETNGYGNPIVLYDQIADRWVISQIAGTNYVPTDECLAVSTSGDATGSYYRYDFHLGSNIFDSPKLAVWQDAYYLGVNVFDSTTYTYLGPQPVAFDRSAILLGNPFAGMISFTPLSTDVGFLMPADLEGSILPPGDTPHPWMGALGSTWPIYRFHVDWVTPANSTFTLVTSLTPATYTDLCPSTRSCVPQLDSADGLDGVGTQPMFRLVYRRFQDGHEALVGNRSVDSGGVSGIRWWEINNATSGTPSFVQQSTYQPDTTWRWLGSIAMDAQGNIALGFSASSSSIFPQIRYAGRLAIDPLNTLGQGETTLYTGTGSQIGTSNRWGGYSDLTVDPVDDCTFWYTNEYYATTSSFNWRTRIGSFRFPSCTNAQNYCPAGTKPNLLYANDFEADPIGWTHSSGVGPDTWVITSTNPHSGVLSWLGIDVNSVSDQRLVSPAFVLPTGQNPLVLTFWHYKSIESFTNGCFDGAILEVSPDNGLTWTQLMSPDLLTDPYDGIVSGDFSNPLAGLSAWCGDKPYLRSSVNLSAYAGQTVLLRFRLGTDSSVGRPGWNVDDVSIQSCLRSNYLPFIAASEVLIKGGEPNP
jgi:hypothetical protein